MFLGLKNPIPGWEEDPQLPQEQLGACWEDKGVEGGGDPKRLAVAADVMIPVEVVSLWRKDRRDLDEEEELSFSWFVCGCGTAKRRVDCSGMTFAFLWIVLGCDCSFVDGALGWAFLTCLAVEGERTNDGTKAVGGGWVGLLLWPALAQGKQSATVVTVCMRLGFMVVLG